MKLLFVMDHDGANNGVTISARRYAQVLRQRGHDVRFLCTGDPGPGGWSLEQFHLPLFDGLITAQGMVFAKVDRAVLTQAISWADAVHFLMPFTLSICGAAIAKKLGKPITAAFHVQPQNISYSIHMGSLSPVNALIYWYFRVSFFRRFTHIHCPSEFIAGELRRHHYKAKLHVISNGIEPAFTYRKLPKPPQWEGKFVILSIGRLSREKRQDVLIDAIALSRHRDSIHLELAGQGPLEAALRRRAEKLPGGVHIAFYDRDALRDLIARCDLYVHPADAEIEAMSCMEAFASGLVPVIADSPKSATPQFALDERSLFPAGDPKALAQKIDWWIDHPAQRAEMERRYSAQAAHYALEDCVTRFEAMVEENFAGSGARL